MLNLIKGVMIGTPESGRQIISRVPSSFRAVREELKQGVALCDTEIAEHEAEVTRLRSLNEGLTADRVSAIHVIQQIDALVK